jgi:hypothetical protein
MVTRLEQHVHLVIRHTTSIVKLFDQLVLATSASSPLSLEPSSACSALDDPIWRRTMEYAALVANNSWDLVPRPPGSNVMTGN